MVRATSPIYVAHAHTDAPRAVHASNTLNLGGTESRDRVKTRRAGDGGRGWLAAV